MTKEECEQAISSLLSGEIEEILITKEDFFTFRDVWIDHAEKNQIEGEASLGGRVIYRLIKADKPK